MILYEVYNGDDAREVFRSKRDAVKRAREIFNETDGPASVWVTQLVMPPPSADLVMSILNETGYVIEQHDVLKLER